jgi:putative acetyltransferase
MMTQAFHAGSMLRPAGAREWPGSACAAASMIGHNADRTMASKQRPVIELAAASREADLLVVRELINEYARSLRVDLCFQDLDAELASMPGHYGEPHGALRLARVGGSPAGCCAMRPLDNVDHANACEMKRLYVRPAFRGLGIGRMLAESVIEAARVAGYRCILLDTLSDMETARAMYQDLGFFEVPPYYYNPIPGAHYLKAHL